MPHRRFLALAAVAVMSACDGPRLDPAPPSAPESRSPRLEPPPRGQPEPTRYSIAYRAFWWNCVMLRAGDLRARCPFTCSGTAAAASGCADGANAAQRQIDELLGAYPEEEVQEMLRSYASSGDAAGRLAPYFQDGPMAEPAR